MCTALSFKKGVHFFGRNLDMEFSYGESVAVVPRAFGFEFSDGSRCENHLAMIGVAHVAGGYPLFFDGVNEKGLGVAALNFPHFARYFPPQKGKINIAPYEFIPRVLCECESVEDAKKLLKNASIADLDFSPDYKNTTLHWMIADSSGAIVVESIEGGLKIYDNPVGVLTNSPTFDVQLFSLNDYMALTREPAKNNFAEGLGLTAYSRGMGGMGLPGDFSSKSRFVRAVFMRENSVCGKSESEVRAQFFQILGGVAQQKGCVHLGEGKYEYTVYTSACDTKKGVYYYTTYDGTALVAVDMHRENLDCAQLISYPMRVTNNIIFEN